VGPKTADRWAELGLLDLADPALDEATLGA
jgi:hypothetical protein